MDALGIHCVPGRVRIMPALAVLFGFALITLSACVTSREAVSRNEDHLAAGGQYT